MTTAKNKIYLFPTCLKRPIKYFAKTKARITPTTSSMMGPTDAIVVCVLVATADSNAVAVKPVA